MLNSGYSNSLLNIRWEKIFLGGSPQPPRLRPILFTNNSLLTIHHYLKGAFYVKQLLHPMAPPILPAISV